MVNNQEALSQAMSFAFAHKPAVGGFPFLAECLRMAGVVRNVWTLPAAQSIYHFDEGTLITVGEPVVTGMHEVPPFNEMALIEALRADQQGASTFPAFLRAAWAAGVVTYEVDFAARQVTYRGAAGESYAESYASVVVSMEV